jgi:uncharacterized protein YjgD (DUF1641 family)
MLQRFEKTYSPAIVTLRASCPKSLCKVLQISSSCYGRRNLTYNGESSFIPQKFKKYCYRKGELEMPETITQTKPEQESLQISASQGQLDVLDQLLKPEVQESLTTLVDQLPKLTELVNILTKSYDFAQAVATDEVLKNDTVGAIQELAEPVKDTVKTIAATAIEAKDRAEESNEVIGLFGLLKMLKDPQAQKMFRFVSAYLQITAERNHK